MLRELDGHHVSITGPQFAYLSFLSLHSSFGFAHVERRIFNPKTKVKRKPYLLGSTSIHFVINLTDLKNVTLFALLKTQ